MGPEISQMDSKPFIEHRVDRGQGKVYARDYGGAGPAFVLMHGFPDNLRIYDDLIPYLLRRIERRLQVNELRDLPSYRDFLRGHPAETRALLASALAMLDDKRERLSPRKHDNTPC